MIKNQEPAETAIREARKTVDYNTVEYPLEYFIDKISQQQINDNLSWDESKQSYFIESLILGLPVLQIVFVDSSIDSGYFERDAQLIDGRQRIYTALNFINGNLRLRELRNLSALNGFKFKDLPLSRQKKLRRITARAIAVNPNSDLSIWRNKYRW